ncbi:DUF5008 domain-containing protein [Pedobacter frigoris]|uniref:DUF5008 domain-containing protein n=1 Tax=Pedobacter frigoris TaxID=2571272 RepID=A0A4U1CFN1_9SPHI|nr:DUF5008 domain-containing protein [Pedobacter frigoris]TKC05147.1 DUF5008 domain-containing protein [Pedobacter frigoris]
MLNRTNNNNQKMNAQKWYFLCLTLLSIVFFSCKKSEKLQDDPYAGGKEALGIRFADATPKPAFGITGAEVIYQISGLLPFKDKMKFYLNETEATVLEVTDKSIKIKVPENASSGGVTIVIDGQIFFGPEFTVSGKAGIDPTFKTIVGTNRVINQIMPLQNGNFIFVGGFTDFDKGATTKKPINYIVSTTSDGTYLPSFSTGAGANGTLASMVKLPNGQFMVGGSFTAYNKRKSIGGITRLNSNGSLDSTIVEVVNLTPLEPKNSYDTLAAFNGSVTGSVRKIFSYNDKIIAVGSFNNYGEYFYERSTRDNKVIGYTKMTNVLRLKSNGKLDSTYNFNTATNMSYEGGNGAINDAFMQADGKIILVGSFSRYNATTANYIVRLDNNGVIDPTFQVGTGADAAITNIRYNTATQKFMVSGAFKNFNGKPANGLVMLNNDGSVDQSFVMGSLEGGSVGFSAQLSSGLILVTGSFTKYNTAVRQGFMILNSDGTLAAGYNNTGMFQGVVSDIYETKSALGFPAVLMVGNISKFDNKTVGNIVRVILRP